MGATTHWRVCVCVVTLTTGSRSFAAFADQAQQQFTPKERIERASLPAQDESTKERDTASPIIITGSRIPRTDLTAVSPVAIVDGYEFKLQGATNAEEALNQLPQVNPSQGEFGLSGVTGTATVDLRGLGPARTLVLVNGKRLMPGDPRFPVPDINAIPLSIVERVELLTGGAAAIYGSDAVAGVVNFILQTKLDGLKIEAEIGAFQHDNRDRFAQGLLDQRQLPYPTGSVIDGWRRNVSVAFGRSLLNSRANITLYGGYRKIEGVTQDERDHSACPINARFVDGRAMSQLQCGGSVVSYPGNFFDNLGNSYQVTAERTFVPGISRYNFSPWNYFQRPAERFTGGGFATFDLSDAFQAYTEVMAMKDRTLWQVGPSGNFRDTETINCDNPLLSDQQKSLICRPGNFVTDIPAGSPILFVDPVTGMTYSRALLLIGLRNAEGGPIQDDLRHKSVRLLGGLKGTIQPGVSYDASYLFGRVRLDRQYRNNVSITRLGRALDVVSDPSTGQPICRSALIARELGLSALGADSNCVPWDIFATGQVTPESIAYLSIPPSMRGSFKEQVGNVNSTVELDRWGVRSPWSDEGTVINVGAEFRKDSVQFDPDEFAQAGDIAGFGEQVFPIRGSINTKEIFGEARIPLIIGKPIQRLTFEGGLRKSWYRNSKGSFSSGAHKLTIDLTAVTGLRFRASQHGANRTPNVLELFAPVQPDSFLRDPCAGANPEATETQCALTGVTPTQYGQIVKTDGSLFGYNAITGGNEGLQVEKATTYAIGIVLEPRILRSFHATIDWWDIRLKDAVSKIGAQTIIDSCIASGDPFFCSRIHRDPNGSLWLGRGHVDNRLANLGSLRVRGIDGSADYSIALGHLGSASFAFRGSYVLRWIVDNGGQSTPYDCVGLFGEPCGIQPRWKHSARATWDTMHEISLSLQWRHTASMKLAALDPKFNLMDTVSLANTKLPAQNYLDVATAFRLREGLELRLGVNNALDRQPPLVVNNTAAGGGPSSGNTYPQWYDPLGRYIFASIGLSLNP